MNISRRMFIKGSAGFLGTGLFLTLPGTGTYVCPLCKTTNFLPNKCFGCGEGLMHGGSCTIQNKKLNYRQIPFPNHQYLIETAKPALSLDSIIF